MDVLTPRTLEEALRLKAERPAAVPIQGGTDLMVELNFDRSRPGALLNLNEVPELRGWSRDGDTVWLGAGLTYVEAMEPRLAEALPALAEAARTVGWAADPEPRHDRRQPRHLLTGRRCAAAAARVRRHRRSSRAFEVSGRLRCPSSSSGPSGTSLAEDELILGVSVDATESRQTFMKVGPRNAMVIAVVSLAVRVDGELRAAFGSAGPVPTLVRAELADADSFPQRVAEAASPIDDVRGIGGVQTARTADPHEARARPVPRMRIELRINGEPHETDVWEGESLLYVLRERLGFPGSKNACEQGECGSCSVLLDGKLVCACLVLAAQAEGHEVVTVEGLAEGGRLHKVQQAFVATGAVQCGFCTPGFVVATADLLARNVYPSDDDIREALSGNLCRCTGYAKIFDAVRMAAAAL